MATSKACYNHALEWICHRHSCKCNPVITYSTSTQSYKNNTNRCKKIQKMKSKNTAHTCSTHYYYVQYTSTIMI